MLASRLRREDAKTLAANCDCAKRDQPAITKHENLPPGLSASKTVGTRRTTYKGSGRSALSCHMQWADAETWCRPGGAGCMQCFRRSGPVRVAKLMRLARCSAPRVDSPFRTLRVPSGQFQSTLMSALPPKADISSVWKIRALGRCKSSWDDECP